MLIPSWLKNDQAYMDFIMFTLFLNLRCEYDWVDRFYIDAETIGGE